MAASLIRRTGLPSAFSKLNPTQPWPRCFGSLTMRPLDTSDGNPIEMQSNFQSAISGLIWDTISRGVMRGPDLNFRFFAREIINFTCVPPTSISKIFFFMIVSAAVAQR